MQQQLSEWIYRFLTYLSIGVILCWTFFWSRISVFSEEITYYESDENSEQLPQQPILISVPDVTGEEWAEALGVWSWIIGEQDEEIHEEILASWIIPQEPLPVFSDESFPSSGEYPIEPTWWDILVASTTPVISVVSEKEPLLVVDQYGRFDPKMLNVTTGELSIALSQMDDFLVLHQVERLLQAWWWDDFMILPRWESEALLEEGLLAWTINEVDGNVLSTTVQTLAKMSEVSVFDAYMQDEGHDGSRVKRLCLFRGSDDRFYVLDGTLSQPIVLDEYISLWNWWHWVQRFLRPEWYSPHLARKEVPVMSWIVVQTGVVTVEVPAQLVEVEDRWGDSTFRDIEDFVVVQHSPTEFVVWDEKAHLTFPEKIALTIEVDIPEGTYVHISVLHEWDAWFTTHWLTTNPNAVCADGRADDEDGVAIVQNWQVTFWSCGASTFMLDPLFPVGGWLNGNVSAIAVQTDGAVVVWWAFTGHNNIPANRLIRYSVTWVVDNSFSSWGWFNNTVSAVAVQADGKILVWWAFTTYSWGAQNRLIRLTTTGARDTTFVLGAGFNNTVNTLVVQADGKIVVGWSFTTYAGVTQNRITRLTSTGARDPTFSGGGWFNNTVNTLAVQADGKILAWWLFTTFSGGAQNRLIRLTTTGARDTTFIIWTGCNNTVNSILVQTDGNIVVWGDFTTYSGVAQNRLTRVTTTGARDPTFVVWWWFSSTVSSIIAQADGKLFVWWAFTTYSGVTQNRLTRLTTTWARDSSFSNGWFNNTVSALALQTWNKLVAWWSFTTYGWVTQNRLVTLQITWAIDLTIPWLWFDNTVNTLAVQSDGKIVVWWVFTSYQWVPQNRITRLTTTGARDPTFIIWTWFNNTVNTLDIQSDGKIVVWGAFTSYSWVAQNRITRLTSTGARDTTFVIGAWAGNTVSTLALQTDGKIVLWWSFTSYAGVTQNRITRLTTTGARDPTFSGGAGFNNTVNTLVVQSDGKIVAWWAFTTYSWTAQNRVIRLTATWARDTTFSIWTGFNNTVNTLAVQTDGNIVVWWAFTSYSWVVQNRVTRLTTTWLRDVTFSGGGGFNNTVTALAVQSDGKIVAWWAFTTYSGVTQNRVTRLTTTWARDTTLVIGVGFDNTVNAVISESPYSLLAWWAFLSFNTQSVHGLARLFGVEWPTIVFPSSGQVVANPDIVISGTGQADATVTIILNWLVRTGAVTATGARGISFTWLTTWPKIATGYVNMNGNRSDPLVRMFSVTQGDVCIIAPWTGRITTGIVASNIAQLATAQSDYFRVVDELGAFSGYYTTLQIGTLTWPSASLPTTTIERKADPLVVLSWSINSGVVLWSWMDGYTFATAPVTFIKRDPGLTWASLFGVYWSKLSLRFTIPAYQPVGTYTGTLIYTLYEN